MVNFSVFVLVNDELTKHVLSYRLGTLTHFLHLVSLPVHEVTFSLMHKLCLYFLLFLLYGVVLLH